jgi:hypothetical protein
VKGRWPSLPPAAATKQPPRFLPPPPPPPPTTSLGPSPPFGSPMLSTPSPRMYSNVFE